MVLALEKKVTNQISIYINVAQLLKEPTGATRCYKISEIASPETAQKVAGELSLMRSQRGILISGELTVQADAICSRCLGPFSLNLNLKIEDEFLPRTDMVSGLSVSLPDDEVDAAVFITEEHIIDLGEIIRQYLILAMPMKPLCRSDCAGLCPVCGANLDWGACKCAERSDDQHGSKPAE